MVQQTYFGSNLKYFIKKIVNFNLFILILVFLFANNTIYAKDNHKKHHHFIKVNKTITGIYGDIQINGYYKHSFKDIFLEFEKNFLERGEAGASVCVTEKGKPVVDLWGGFADVDTQSPWQEDTITCIFSSTKGASAFVIHLLASRGLIDIDAPVTDYWPEFGQNGKEKTTVRMVLNHTTGLPVFTEPLYYGAVADWDYIIQTIEEQAPLWEPGKAHGYQALIFGFIAGEIVLRVTGKTIGTVFKEEIAEPLGIDFTIGLPQSEYYRAATMLSPPTPEPPFSEFLMAIITDPDSIPGLMALNDSGFGGNPNDPIFRTSEIPAGNGYTNAKGMAKMYMPLALGGKYNNIEFIDPEIYADMTSISAAGFNRGLLSQTRWALGFLKSFDNRKSTPGNTSSIILSEAAFGHAGMGGSVGFADPVEKVSFAYLMNQLGPEIIIDERCQSLIDAMYTELGYTSNASGRWIK